MIQLIRQFCRSRRGNFAMIFAIAAPVLFIAAASSVDIARMVQTRSAMQSSLDAALLAASRRSADLPRETSNDERLRIIRDVFERVYSVNFGQFVRDPNYQLSRAAYTFAFDRSGNMVDATVKHPFLGNTLGSFGVGDRDLAVGGSAGLAEPEPNFIIDIVMCLDATGSMHDTLAAAQANARSFNKDLRNALGVKAYGAPVKVRVKPSFYRDFTDWVKYTTVGFIDLDPSKASGLNQDAQNARLETFLGSQSAQGGGDWSEAAGACLIEGITAPWMAPDAPEAVSYFSEIGTAGNKTITIPVIVFWTDATISPLVRTQQYVNPKVPTTYPLFEAVWNDARLIDQDNKLLIHFGPGTGDGWNTVMHWDGYHYGGSLETGNDDAAEIIAEIIKGLLPDLLRLLS